MADGTITLLNDEVIHDVYTVGLGGDFRGVRVTGEYFAVAYRVNGEDTLRVTSYTCDTDGVLTQIDTQDFANPQGDSLEYVHEFFKVADNVFGIITRHIIGLNGLNNRKSGICTVSIDDSGNIGGSLLDYGYIRSSGDGDQWKTRPYNCVIQLGSSTYFAIPYLYEYYVVEGNLWTKNPRICTISIASDGTIGAIADDKSIYASWGNLLYGSICHVSGDVYAIAVNRHVRTMTLSSSDGSITAIAVKENITNNDMPFILRAIGNYYAIITGVQLTGGSSGIVYSLEIADDGTIANAITDRRQWETTRGGYNWGVRTIVTASEAWFIVSGNASDWDGKLRTFKITSSGTVSMLGALKEFTGIGVYSTKILRFDQSPGSPYYIVAASCSNSRGYIQSFEIDELLPELLEPGFIWVEGTKLHYIDANGVERAEEGTVTGDTGDAGFLWMEGNNLHYIDESGAERYIAGTDTGADHTAGYLWIEGQYLHFNSENGDERRFRGTAV